MNAPCCAPCEVAESLGDLASAKETAKHLMPLLGLTILAAGAAFAISRFLDENPFEDEEPTRQLPKETMADVRDHYVSRWED